jgi:hypothetical protein
MGVSLVGDKIEVGIDRKPSHLRIDYFVHDRKVADSIALHPVEHAERVAKRGLSRHKADYARIVDPDHTDKLVGMVHRDVRL